MSDNLLTDIDSIDVMVRRVIAEQQKLMRQREELAKACVAALEFVCTLIMSDWAYLKEAKVLELEAQLRAALEGVVEK